MLVHGAAWIFAGLVLSEPAQVQLHEVLAGVNGDSGVQCLELRLTSADENRWGPLPGEAEGRAMLVFHDAAGTERGRYVFPSDPPVGTPDANGFHSVLVATAGFAALPGAPAPDFILPSSLMAPVSGKVCLKANPHNPGLSVNLCLSYGDFTGDTETDSENPPNPAGAPAADLPTTGAWSLKRFRNFGEEFFGRHQSNGDFRLEPPGARNSAGATAAIDAAPLVEQGRNLFFKETFLGNGRTCGTCHPEDTAFALSPDTVAALPPDAPLFVAEQVPALAGLEDSARLRSPQALILENIDGFDREPVFRGSPPLFNLPSTAPYGLSGETDDLRDFIITAVKQHLPRSLARNADPGAGALDFRLPTPEELDALEAFMNSLALPENVNLMLASAAFRGADRELLLRGRDQFFGEGKCSRCHNGPALSDVDPSMVREGLVPKGGNVSFDTGVDASLGPDGDREFNTRPLLGVSLRKRFFHDNSALDLESAILFYAFLEPGFFGSSPAGQLVGQPQFELEAMKAFLEALVEPAPECRGGEDCDGDGINDTCELLLDPGLDCNANGIKDACDIASGVSRDSDADGLPDECEPAGLFDLDGLHPTRGFTVEGISSVGYVFVAAGDVTGDGVAELFLVNPAELSLEPYLPGAVHVVRGGRDLAPGGHFDAASLDGTNGFSIRHREPGIVLGGSLSCAGDVNADGINDIVIGTLGHADVAPRAYVVFGGTGLGRDGIVDLSLLSGEDGYVVVGSGLPGVAVAAGDFNGDGAADVIMDFKESLRADRLVNVVFGGRGVGARGVFDLASLDGENGLTMSHGDLSLDPYVAAGGDLNGDGYADLYIRGGEERDEPYAFVVLGRAGSPGEAYLELPDPGFLWFPSRDRRFGHSASLSGDLDGDGLDDLLIGGEKAHVMFGGDLRAWGLELEGVGAQEGLGSIVSVAGDLNGDGFDDIAAAAVDGQVYVIFGGPDLRGGDDLDIARLDGANGVILKSASSQQPGPPSVAVGDINGDGLDDLALGATFFRKVQVVYGPLHGLDCNANGVFDSCDIAEGTSLDGNLNRVPDECEGRSRSSFHRGDPNGDGKTDISDALHTLNHLFLGGDGFRCLESADATDDGRIDISDAISLLSYLFLGRAAPPAPGPAPLPCGDDPAPPASPRYLGCKAYAGCEG